MFTKLLTLFIVVPIIEIYVLVTVGEHIGAAETIFLVILTGIAGASFAKSQGAQIIYKIRAAMQRGEMPGKELLHGAMVLAGGIMLLTPGFITDLLGLSLLFPLTRQFYTALAVDYFKKKMSQGQWTFTGNGKYYNDETEPQSPSDIIIDHPRIDEPGEK